MDITSVTFTPARKPSEVAGTVQAASIDPADDSQAVTGAKFFALHPHHVQAFLRLTELIQSDQITVT